MLLAIGDGEAGRIQENHVMHAKANAGCLRNIFEQVHLLAAKADSMDMVALSPKRIEHAMFTDLDRDAVDQHVLGALRRVQALEALTRVSRWKSGEVVGDRVTVAIVPVFDPSRGFAAGEVLRLRAAAELGWRQSNMAYECSWP